jgi:TonB family protein
MNRRVLFLKVVLVHVVFVLALAVFPLMSSCQWFKPVEEQTMSVDLSALPPLPEPPVEPDEPEVDPEEDAVIPDATPVPTAMPTATPTLAPEAEPTAAPAPTATARPTATPKPQPTPTPKSRLLTPEEIRRRIEQNQNPQPVATRRPLTAEEVAAQMGSGLPSGNSGGGSLPGTGQGNRVSIGTVKEELDLRLYQAWTQPPTVSSALGLTVDVSVRVEPDGQISAARILKASGHPEMDASVRKALELVRRVRAFPSEYSGSGETFDYTFRIK